MLLLDTLINRFTSLETATLDFAQPTHSQLTINQSIAEWVICKKNKKYIHDKLSPEVCQPDAWISKILKIFKKSQQIPLCKQAQFDTFIFSWHKKKHLYIRRQRAKKEESQLDGDKQIRFTTWEFPGEGDCSKLLHSSSGWPHVAAVLKESFWSGEKNDTRWFRFGPKCWTSGNKSYFFSLGWYVSYFFFWVWCLLSLGNRFSLDHHRVLQRVL